MRCDQALNMAISYIICAAGKGTRTKEISQDIPKALLQINGLSFLEYALNSLPIQNDDQIIVVSQRQDRLSRIQERVSKNISKAHLIWFDLDYFTRGQLETAVTALKLIDRKNSIAIFNADSCFECPDLLSSMTEPQFEGIIPCSIEAGEAWSFCRVSEENRLQKVVEVQEKKRISKWCSVGFYFFRNYDLFEKLASEELRQESAEEYYVSRLYNHYLSLGYSILMLPVQSFKAMGSVEQIKRYWTLSIDDVRNENFHSLLKS